MDERWRGDPLAAFGVDWEDGMPRTTNDESERVNKLKALGNSVVPQLAFLILGAIVEADRGLGPSA